MSSTYHSFGLPMNGSTIDMYLNQANIILSNLHAVYSTMDFSLYKKALNADQYANLLAHVKKVNRIISVLTVSSNITFRELYQFVTDGKAYYENIYPSSTIPKDQRIAANYNYVYTNGIPFLYYVLQPMSLFVKPDMPVLVWG